jgi:uncharacterized protein (TIGR03000 family)
MSRSVPRLRHLAALLLLASLGLVTSRAADDDKKPATVVVHLPKGASLVIGGMESKQTGPDRNFDTPDLPAGQTFSYQLEASWTEDGKEVKRALKLIVLAGETTEVDLNTYTGTGPVRPKTSKPPEPPPTPAGSFALEPLPPELTLKTGEKKALLIRIKRKDLQEPVKVAFAGVPNGVTLKDAVIPADKEEATVEVVAAADAPAATAAVTVEASAGAVTRKGSLKLAVEGPAATLNLAVPDEVEVKAGGETEVKLLVQGANLKEPVRVTFPELPPGVTVKEQTVKPAAGQTMTPVLCRVVAGDKAPAGKRRVRVLAVSGDVKVEGKMTLAVRKADATPAPPAPKAAALKIEVPGAAEVQAGEKKDVPVKVTRDNYDGPVTLALTGLPKGVTAAEQVIPAGRTEAVVSLLPERDAPEGMAEATVEARGGSARATAKLRVVVRAAKAAPPPAAAAGTLELQFPITQVTLQPGSNKLVQIKVNRKGFEGPVTLKFEKVPPGVTLREVTVPADRKQFYIDAAAAAGAKEGETEIKVVGSADRVRAEVPFKVIVKK